MKNEERGASAQVKSYKGEFKRLVSRMSFCALIYPETKGSTDINQHTSNPCSSPVGESERASKLVTLAC